MNSKAQHRLIQVLLTKKKSILLGKHKVGPFEGRWTGLISPWRANTSWQTEARKATHMLAGINISSPQVKMNQNAILTFEELRKGPQNLPSHTIEYQIVANINSLSEEQSKATDTAEFEFKWYPFSEIPYDAMPADDELWYPFVLQGKFLRGHFVFDGVKLVSHSVNTVQDSMQDFHYSKMQKSSIPDD